VQHRPQRFVGWLGHFDELRSPVIAAPVHAVQDQAVQVEVQVGGRAQALNQSDRTAVSLGTISSYAVQKSGAISLSQTIAATSGAGPIDAAISASGRALFVLNAGSRAITSFGIGKDGRLSATGSVGGLPAGANGLAAN
jgi:6-phosphogluconolactonase (cycloisomerase 2 family)